MPKKLAKNDAKKSKLSYMKCWQKPQKTGVFQGFGKNEKKRQKKMAKKNIIGKINCSVMKKNTSGSKKPYRSTGYGAQLRLTHIEKTNKIHLDIVYRNIIIRIPQMPILTLLVYRCLIRPLLRTTKQDNNTTITIINKKYKKEIIKKIETLRKQFLKPGKSYKYTGKTK